MDSVSADANARDYVMFLIRLTLLSLAAACLSFGDGGAILVHQHSGDFDITVFNKAEKVHAGQNDFSVLVERNNTTVMNASVLLHLEQTSPNGEIARITGVATHAKATNKTLYASILNIPSTGRWTMRADVTSAGLSGAATVPVDVLPPAQPVENYWPYIAMVPALGLAFIINRKLRRKYRPHSR